MATTLNDLGKTLLAQLYNIVTGGDEHIPPSPNNFLSWCQPGIPFEPVDFTFSAKGIGGGGTAEEDKLLLQEAFNFAQVVDFVPDKQAYTTTICSRRYIAPPRRASAIFTGRSLNSPKS